jgi:hypothetical protein
MKKFIYFIIILTFSISVYSQNSEFGFGIGVCSYFGDLGRNNLENTHPAGQIFYCYPFNKFLNARVSLGYGTISGDDKNAQFDYQKERNLSFRSSISEFSGILELRLLSNDYKLIPYIYGGINVFHFNPKTMFNGEWIFLRDLGTEGQGSKIHPDRLKYDLYESSLVFGFGLKIPVSSKISLSLDSGWRRTNTDYIDDVGGEYVNYFELFRSSGVMAAKLSDRTPEYFNIENTGSRQTGSQRGGSNVRDYYFMSFINFDYNISGNNNFQKRGNIKCPKF